MGSITRMNRWAFLLFVFALFATACGGEVSDSADDADATAADESPADDATDTADDSDDGGSSDDATESDDADEPSTDPAEIARLRDALDTLSDADRQTIELRHHAALSFQQIADTLEEPLGTVLARHHRALKKLRSAMEKAEEETP